MENNRWVIYDGNLIRAVDPVVPVESRGLMYGDGCFETLRVYKGAFFRLEEHLSRFKSAAEFLGLDYPEQLEESSIKELSENLLDKNKLSNKDAVIRIQLWRSGKRGYSVSGENISHFSMLATPLPEIPTSIALASVDVKRIPNKALPSRYKLTNNINYITAARQAAQKNADDALMQTVEGYLSETTIANLFWISGNTVFTPSLACDLLPGITRSVLIHLIGEFDGVVLKEGEYFLEEIYKADAVWICNSVREVVAVSQVDGVRYNEDHFVNEKLKESYKNFLLKELKN